MPPRTLPPGEPTARRHRPVAAGRWSPYRSCLRWDFGFTCPFCLLHEADLYGGLPGEGLGGTTVEHHVARSADAAQQNDYDNCLYACRFCNRSRSASPVRLDGVRLLDPTRDAWADHFEAVDDRLLPLPESPEAAYTHRAYELDDARKVVRRQMRRLLLGDRLFLLARLQEMLTELLDLAEEVRRLDSQEFGRILQEIRQIRADARRALSDLRRYAAIPPDAPRVCRCRTSRHHSLPPELDRQTLEIPETWL